MEVLVHIAEDDDDVRALYVDALRGAGYAVVESRTIRATLDAIRLRRPNLIVMDRHLLDGDAWSAVTKLKQDPATAIVPVLALTASTSPSDVQAALLAGCDGFLAKPCDGATLISHAQRLLGPATGRSPRKKSP